MQIDFHFYAIYALSRLAGINEIDSKRIAYSSQHTDDAKYDHELIFKSGGRYKQEMSAHKFIDLESLTKATAYDIFIPFHFLPGVEGDSFDEKLICRQNSLPAQEMLEDTLKTLDKPYGMHRLGIALHIYADTWSHQNFVGLINDYNSIEDLDGEGYPFQLNLKDQLYKLSPPIGHGKVWKYPDIPFIKWNYKYYNGEDSGEIDNLTRTLDAAKHIYEFLVERVREVSKDIFVSEPMPWDEVKIKLSEILSKPGELEHIEKLWQEKFIEGYFGFNTDITYDDREWFREAIEVYRDEYYVYHEIYDKKANFEKSEWKYFQDALTYHKFYIKHELLSKYEIFI